LFFALSAGEEFAKRYLGVTLSENPAREIRAMAYDIRRDRLLDFGRGRGWPEG
jgi:hypothetical protein